MKTKTQEIFELSCPYGNEAQGTKRRVLFVCSAGMLRSPTAASVAIELGFNARSCGSHNFALIPLSANLIHWAESIFFVNVSNWREARWTFTHDVELMELLEDKSTVWDIEDDFDFDDPMLRIRIKDLLS